MPYKSHRADEVKFVGTGSTSFVSGSSQYIDCGNDSSLDVGDGGAAFTVMAWSKGTTNDILSKWESGTGGYSMGFASDKPILFYYSTSYFIYGTSSGISSDEWHHIVFTKDNQTSICYVDGVEQLSETSELADINTTSNNFKIGNGRFGYFDGSIKNVAIWERALTATEVQNVMYKSYAEVSGRLASGLVSWWALDVDYTDYHGDNDGTNSGSTLDTDLYGGDTPVKPRAIDNAPTVQADAIGSGSALFDGTDDYISITETTLDTDGNCSISFWHKHGGAGATAWAVLGHTSTANERYLRFLASDGKLKFESDTGGDVAEITLNTAFTDEQWHHYALVFTSGTLTAYQDSVSLTVANPSMSDDTTINLIGGQHTSGDSYNISGNLAQFGIWDEALTQEQIQSVMEKTFEEFTASEKTNLVSYWALDEDVLSDTVVVDKVNPSYSLGSELLTNGDMELDDSSWTSVVSPVTNERSTEQVHGGTYSRKLVGDSSYDGMYQAITAVAGKKYLLTGWVYGDGTNKLYARFYDDGGGGIENFWIATSNDGVIVPAEWTYYSKAIVAVGTTLTVQFYQGDTSAGGVTFYADDISVKEIISDGNVGVLY